MTCRNPYVVTERCGTDKFYAHCLTCMDASEPTSHKPRLEDWRRQHIKGGAA